LKQARLDCSNRSLGKDRSNAFLEKMNVSPCSQHFALAMVRVARVEIQTAVGNDEAARSNSR
jgi:hypothetical protein